MSAPTPPQPATVWVVRNVRGGPYDFGRDMREQNEWKEHAAFMNALVDEGVIVIGGPLGGGVETLLLCASPTEDALRRRLGDDPWMRSGMLTTTSIERLTVALSPAAVDQLLAPAPTGVPDGGCVPGTCTGRQDT